MGQEKVRAELTETAIRDLERTREAMLQAERAVTMAVEHYVIGGVPLDVMLEYLGWSLRTYYRRKAEVARWASSD